MPKSANVVKPKRRRYKLFEFMGKFKPKHKQGEWNLGEPVGKEVW